MFERIKTTSGLVLILSNLIPIYGVFYQNWDAFWIVLLYWSENLIIGFYNVLRMVFVKVKSPAENLGKLFMIPFFIFHYGAFCAGHGLFILAMFKKDPGSIFEKSTNPSFFIFMDLLMNVIKKVLEIFPTEMIIPFLTLFLSHGFSFVYNFIMKGEYKNVKSKDLMSQPYMRIIVLHVAIIAGAFPVMYFGSPVYLLVVLIFIKIMIDLYLHNKEHKKLQREKPQEI
ncbi:MAG: hypothetical protein GWO07_14580 [Candidatus Dadabacteria bacterium]|nr:hypothetical protein [Candidatus Dadabacteria bacterium]NIS09937.1 hypothetical protein [Candidatus Dadabacteria bacterium]NIY22555.1 hypothetical protein [Candidatus Dadabacteria bacterium]